jgi:hypothetical protein
MLDAGWPGRVVTDGSLAQAIRDVRAALGAVGRDLVKTVARRGYMIAVPSVDDAALRPASVPAAIDTLIGREEAVEEVSKLLDRHRLVTVLGPGGIGKTRLAQAVASQSIPRFPDGVWWVDLIPLQLAEDLRPAIAAETRLAHLGGGAEGLARACGGLHALLVLDNCEHLVEPVAEMAHALLAAGAERLPGPDLQCIGLLDRLLGIPQSYPRMPRLQLGIAQSGGERRNPQWHLVAVGICFCNRERSDLTGGARAIVDDQSLPKEVLKFARIGPRRDIGRTAGWIRVDDAHSVSGPSVCARSEPHQQACCPEEPKAARKGSSNLIQRFRREVQALGSSVLTIHVLRLLGCQFDGGGALTAGVKP